MPVFRAVYFLQETRGVGHESVIKNRIWPPSDDANLDCDVFFTGDALRRPRELYKKYDMDTTRISKSWL